MKGHLSAGGVLDETLRCAPVGMARVALDGRWLYVNPRACEITGRSEAELLSTNFQAITHADDLPADMNFARRLIEGEISEYRMEKRYVRPDGAAVWVMLSVALVLDADNRPLHFISVIQDISREKRAEQRLQNAFQRLRRLFRTLPVGAVRTDSRGRFLDVNPAFCAMVGYKRKELLTKSFFDITVEEDRERDSAALANMQARNQRSYKTRKRYLSKSGGVIPVEVTVNAIFESGRLDHTVAVVRDLQPEERAEDAEREIANARLHHEGLIRGQEAERRRIAQEIHDDATQQLAMIAMRADRIADLRGDAEAFEAETRKLLDDVERCNLSLRSVSHRLHPATLERFGLSRVLQLECIEANGLSARSRVIFASDPPAPTTELQPELALGLYRIAQEALQNALRHSGAKAISAQLTFRKDTVTLVVSDDGQGFEPSRTEQAGSLGLLSMRDRARHLNGDLRIDSSPGEGTTITVDCPLRRANEPRA